MKILPAAGMTTTCQGLPEFFCALLGHLWLSQIGYGEIHKWICTMLSQDVLEQECAPNNNACSAQLWRGLNWRKHVAPGRVSDLEATTARPKSHSFKDSRPEPTTNSRLSWVKRKVSNRIAHTPWTIYKSIAGTTHFKAFTCFCQFLSW